MADADFDGSMPQALLLLNGELTNNGSRAGRGRRAGRDPAPQRATRPSACEQMFLAVYSPPAHRRGDGRCSCRR